MQECCPPFCSDETGNNGKHDWKTKQTIMKPKCIVDYNCKMDAAYQSDLLLSYVQCICMLSNEE
jgi:hypothetical protein